MLAPDTGPEASSTELSATIRIVLADDHAVVRRGLKLLLDSEPGFEVVAEAGDIDDARRYVRGHHPAVLVLDLNMHGDSSLEAIPVIRGESPDTQIVVLTMEDQPEYAREALAGGAIGYVLKEAAEDELVEAVCRGGRRGLPQPAPGRSRRRPACRPTGRPHGPRARGSGLIALGHTNSEIGDQLYLSVRTVETHRAHIQQKLRLDSRAELVRYALDRGLLKT